MNKMKRDSHQSIVKLVCPRMSFGVAFVGKVWGDGEVGMVRGIVRDGNDGWRSIERKLLRHVP